MAELDLGKVVPDIDYSKAMKAPGAEVCPALNECKKNGYYQTKPTTGGEFPHGILDEQKEGILRVLAHVDETSVLQEWYSLGEEEQKYARIFVKGIWSPWDKILTKKNGMVSTYGATPNSFPIDNADLFKTDGVAMTSKATKGLPEQLVRGKTEGTIMYIREDQSNTAGVQIYYPFDKIYAGKMFIRTIGNQGGNTDWQEVGAPDTQRVILDANTYKENGFRRTDIQTVHLPGVVTGTKKFGMIYYISDNDNSAQIDERGRQIFFELGEEDKEGRIWTRKLNSGIWTNWTFYITGKDLTDNCFLKSEWHCSETTTQETTRPEVIDHGFVILPKGPSDDTNLVMEWAHITIAGNRTPTHFFFEHIDVVYNVQATQMKQQPSDRDVYVNCHVATPGLRDVSFYTSDTGTTHAHVMAIGSKRK